MSVLVEIEGIGFPNKGAELMLFAIADQLRERYGDEIQVCCRPWQWHSEGYRTLGYKNILMSCCYTCIGNRYFMNEFLLCAQMRSFLLLLLESH